MPRRKVEIRLIDGKAARLVTFSKRRKSLFKKARELSTLCNAEVGVVVVSEAQRVTHEASPISIYEIFEKLEIRDQHRSVDQPLENQLDEEDKQFSTELEEFHVKTSIYEIFEKLEIRDQHRSVDQPLENQLDEEDKQFSTELEEFHVKTRKWMENISIQKLEFLKDFIQKMGILLHEKEIHLKGEEGQKNEVPVQLDLNLRLGRG